MGGNFRSESQTEFLVHIRTHKPTVKRGDMASVPTEAELAAQNNPNSKKHLFLLHRIKKPQLDDYCDNLVMSLPPAEDLAADFAENFAENLEEVFEDTTETREDPPVANTSEYLARTETSEAHGIKKKKFFNALTEQCNICHKRFSGQFKLKKHLKKAHNMTLI